MQNRACLLMLAIGFSALCLRAQHSRVESWTEFEFEKELHKKLDWKIGNQVRLTSGASFFKSYITATSFSWRPNKYVRLSPGYRTTFKGTHISHRWHLGTILRYRERPWTFAYSLKFQTELAHTEPAAEHDIRNKINVSLWIHKRLTAFTGSEMFYRVWYKPNLFNEYRIFAGIEIDKKDHQVQVAYMLKREFNVSAPLTAHVIKVGYGLSK